MACLAVAGSADPAEAGRPPQAGAEQSGRSGSYHAVRNGQVAIADGAFPLLPDFPQPGNEQRVSPEDARVERQTCNAAQHWQRQELCKGQPGLQLSSDTLPGLPWLGWLLSACCGLRSCPRAQGRLVQGSSAAAGQAIRVQSVGSC